MKVNKSKIFRHFVCIGLIFFGCTEQFELKTETFEDVLVIEATITDEYKRQEIKISRTHVLEVNTSNYEQNATVKIVDSNQNTYVFVEGSNGLYLSTAPFQAKEGVGYKLFVNTEDGKMYESSQEQLMPKANIDKLYAEHVILNGVSGIQVFLDSSEGIGDSQFFRYEYEETYKIITPYFVFFDAIVSNLAFNPSLSYNINLVSRPQEQKVCYSTNYSNKIILTSAGRLSENSVKQFPIQFIPDDDPMLRDRYSILVKQYVQSVDANNFYKILKELGSDESIFLDNQPGFIQGNVFSMENKKEKVIGYFDISSVTMKRIYFNYTDFDIDLPPYFYDCDLVLWDYSKDGPPPDEELNERYFLYQNLVFDKYKYYGNNDTEYYIVKQECGDCTVFSSSIKPVFWED